jgi:hypothetical protein
MMHASPDDCMIIDYKYFCHSFLSGEDFAALLYGYRLICRPEEPVNILILPPPATPAPRHGGDG